MQLADAAGGWSEANALELWEVPMILTARAFREIDRMRERLTIAAVSGMVNIDAYKQIAQSLTEREQSLGRRLASASDKLTGTAREKLEAIKRRLREQKHGG